ncbi:hypothetical protein CIL05_04970 [Virgibacillus profundi]|uniref:Uncharacterized protein n=1 Tax=Virgibacillus profundi TaxID=2024555 RepID=A0A2A2IFB8_9BACI|nr:hypothetical protein [Virgibacillus profundi]PAV30459.1 hypothetical protein CIL05_04970 [Virgibacillus profundi]PXY54631.1 hypothetical protein CIT14_05055 [Virgibacillus profundi]
MSKPGKGKFNIKNAVGEYRAEGCYICWKVIKSSGEVIYLPEGDFIDRRAHISAAFTAQHTYKKSGESNENLC